ncbi:MAG: hypothetical protein D6795_10635 [Deltaproteobacteria bacterium]|nr:MAG: hypothetical protein D6795_10635 [Deltaproteobacteria bacterium]
MSQNHAHAHAHDIDQAVRTYVTVFVSLAILTLLTVAASYLDFEIHAAHIALALSIAIVKGSLVASYFMHLSDERKTIYWVLMLTVAFFLFLLFLLVGAVHDQRG